MQCAVRRCPLKLTDKRHSLKRKENWRKLLLLGIHTGDKLAKPLFFVAYSRLCRHCRNLAEGGFPFTIWSAFLWDDPDQDQWSEITQIMVDQMNQWILVQSGFIGSFDLPWSEWSRITDRDPVISKECTLHFLLCHYFLGYVTCWNLPWQGLCYLNTQYVYFTVSLYKSMQKVV